MMTHLITDRPAVCGASVYLPIDLVRTALELAIPPGSVRPEDVEFQLRCTLQAHPTGDHHALVLDLAGADTGSVWTHWPTGHLPATLTVRPDCPVRDPASAEPCCEFADHPGGHTWQLDDPDHASDTVAAGTAHAHGAAR
jgi:hypothetical protein